MWNRIRSLIIKELLAVWRDPKSRLILIVPALVQMILFSYATTLEVKNIHIAVLNRDMGVHGLEIVHRLAGSRDLVKDLRLMSSEKDAADALAAQDVLMILRIPDDFSRAIDAGKTGQLDLMLDGRKSNAAQILEGYVTSIAQQYAQDLGPTKAQRLKPQTIAVAPRAFFNPNLESSWNTVPALTAVLTMIMGLVVTGLSVARERELGTFEQLLVSPATPAEIIIGKTVPGLLIGMVEGSVIIAFAHWVFGIPLTGSIPLLYVAMAVYLASVIGVGLFISSLVATQQQAMLGAFTFVAPAILLSGFATPIANMPDWLQTVTLGNPARYFLVIVRGVFLKDLPASDIWGQIAPMGIIAAITLAAASWLFRHRLE